MVDFRGILKFPAVVFLRIGLHHAIHHRGQLSMYLRPMGAAVPSIYGESFDASTRMRSTGGGAALSDGGRSGRPLDR